MIGLPGSGDRAALDHHLTNGRRGLFMRASIIRSTQLRYTWSIASVGVQSAAKAWERTSKAFTVQTAA